MLVAYAYMVFINDFLSLTLNLPFQVLGFVMRYSVVLGSIKPCISAQVYFVDRYLSRNTEE